MILCFSNRPGASSGTQWLRVAPSARILFNIQEYPGPSATRIEIDIVPAQQDVEVWIFRFGLLSLKHAVGPGMTEIEDDGIRGAFFVELRGISALAVRECTPISGELRVQVLGHYWIERIPVGTYGTPLLTGILKG